MATVIKQPTPAPVNPYIYTPPVVIPVNTGPTGQPDSTVTTVRTTDENGNTKIEHYTQDFLTPAQRQALEMKSLVAQYSKNPLVWIGIAIAIAFVISKR